MHALGVADHEAGVQCLFHRFGQPIPLEFYLVGVHVSVHLRDVLTELLEGRDPPHRHGGVDGRYRNAQVHRRLAGPLAGALLLGLVQDDVQQVAVHFFVALLQDVGADLDQETIQAPLVPLIEQGTHLVVTHAAGPLQDVVSLGNELHQAVLDAVVHHLDVVPRRTLTDVGHAGVVAHFGGYRFQDGLHYLPRRFVTAGHDAGTTPCPFRTARNAGPEEADVFGLEVLVAAVGVVVVAVPPVDDDVTLVQLRQQTLDHFIDDLAGGHQQHDLARLT